MAEAQKNTSMKGTNMTTELIKTTGITLNGDKITAVNARDLWKFLESKQEFANWIKDRIRKYGFKEGLDFTVDKIINGENKGRFAANKGRFAANEYLITLDMAKELAMVENNERGRQARQYFIEVEKRFRHTGNLLEKAVAAILPVIRENERLKMQSLPGLFEEQKETAIAVKHD